MADGGNSTPNTATNGTNISGAGDVDLGVGGWVRGRVVPLNVDCFNKKSATYDIKMRHSRVLIASFLDAGADVKYILEIAKPLRNLKCACEIACHNS